MNQSPITMEALLVLDAIERRGSFAAAAEQLNKVPSAISYVVQKLEEQLSITLFQRQGRRSVLTPAGVHLLHEGRKVLAAVSKISEQTQTIAHGWEPKIRIAFDSIYCPQEIFAALAMFLALYPEIEIDIQEEVMSGTWERLVNDQVDLLIGAPGKAPKDKGIRSTKLTELTMAFVVAKRHPLAGYGRQISYKDIAQYRTVIVHDSADKSIPWTSGVIEESLHFYVTSVDLKIQAISAGIGGGFVPKNRVESLLSSGALVALDLEHQPEPFELSLAWKIVNRGKGLNALKTLLLENLH